MASKIQLRRDTATRWQEINPVLGAGEPGYETDTGRIKVGNGNTVWNSLPYFSDAGNGIDIPTLLSQLENDVGYITEQDIPAIPTQVSQLANDVGYITAEDVENMPFPTNLSDFTNDVGFITSADIPAIPEKLSDLENDLDFAVGADIPQTVSQLENDAGYITIAQVPSVTVPTKVSDLTNDLDFATTSLVETLIPTNVSDLTNDAGFITLADIPNPIGYTGSQGIQGYTGSAGSQGIQGYTGSAGLPGTTDWNLIDNKPTIPTDVSDLTDEQGLLGGSGSIDLSSVDQDIIPDNDATRSLGSPTKQWKELHVSEGSIYIGNVKLSNQDGRLQVNTIERQVDPETEEEVEVVLDTESVELTRLGHLELTNNPFIFEPYVGDAVSFTKEDYATGAEATDEIDTNLAITRANERGIYNPYLEADWDNQSNDGPSPAGTLWNKDGWGDLTNLNQRIYLSFYETFLRFGNNVLPAEAVMKDVANDKYYKFDFTTWGNASQGAPVAYTRTQIDPVTGESIGDPVEFIKAGYADPTVVNDPIDTGLTLTRGNQNSIYNISLESSYNSQGDGEDSPEGTEWNADGWANLGNVMDRTYGTFLDTLGGRIGENILGTELVMHDTINNKYWAFKFSSWTQDGNGGGFSYTRQQINTSQLFVKTDYGNEVNTFVEDDGNGSGIGITRGDNQGIYNPYREEGWDNDVSPAGTLWNIDGWDDLSNVTSRTYLPFYDAYNGDLGDRVPGSKSVMYIPETDEYYAIQWLSWTRNGEGGGISYLRYKLDLSKLRQGITFTDGTVLKSAEGVGRVKSTASGNRRIEEVVGNKTVLLTEVTSGATQSATIRQNSNSWDFYINADENLNSLYDNQSNFEYLEFSFNSGDTWVKVTFGGGSYGNYYQMVFEDGVYRSVTANDTVSYRTVTGGRPVVWWDKNELPGGVANFRGAVIDYHAFTGEATWIGTIHIVDDDGDENITHTEVSSGSTDSENDDLWVVDNEGTIKYRRIDGEGKTLKVHWTAKVFYGSEYYD
jgi:hypothetical protein